MSYTSLLINSAKVYRNTPGDADVYGQPADSWAVVPTLENIPCRITSHSGREITIGAEVVVTYDTLFLGNVAITEQDRVYVRAGTVPAWRLYEILLVTDRQDGINSHHKECDIRTVR